MIASIRNNFFSLVMLTILCGGVILLNVQHVGAANTKVNDLGNGVIQEKVSGLIWQKERSKRFSSLEQAEQYVANLKLGGYDDWRLPTIYELYGLHYIFDLHKNDTVQIKLEGNYWAGKKDGEGMVGSWEIGDQCEPERQYFKKNKGYVRAVRP